MGANATTPILDLDAFVERQTVRITFRTDEGEREVVLWEMKNKSEVSLSQMKQIESYGIRCTEIVDSGGPHSPEEAAQFDRWIYELMEIVFYTPVDAIVLSRLPYGYKLKILDTFASVVMEQADMTTEPTLVPRKAPAKRAPRARK